MGEAMEYGSEFQRWWPLHLRVARGESLSDEEQTIYQGYLRGLDESENLEPLQRAKQARTDLRNLEAERRQLEVRRQELDAEISALESTLGPQARELLRAEE
jgi:hypothetical protein